jgi:hypothetical protein
VFTEEGIKHRFEMATGTNQSKADFDFGMIITSRFVRQLMERVPEFGPNLEEMQRSDARALEYPDGSLELLPESQALWQNCWRPAQRRRVHCSMLGMLWSLPWLAGLPRPRAFKVLSTKEHEARIDPSAVILFAPGLFSPSRPSESTNLTALHLNLQCHRRLSRDAMRVLADAVCAWQGSVAEAGLFGEGPVGRLSPEIEFQGRRAQFFFDASQTGQRTINWLIVSLLNAAYDVMRLSAFLFNDLGNLATYGFEPSEHKVVCLPLIPGEPSASERPLDQDPASRSSPRLLPFPGLESPQIDQAKASRLPPGLVPFPRLNSQQFTIWQTPSHEWESMRLALYFDDWPSPARQRALRRLLEAWSLIATAGGFGGKGAPRSAEVRFLKTQCAALVQTDLGDADSDIAIPIIIRLLENFSSGTFPIEAVVFGLDPETNLVS